MIFNNDKLARERKRKKMSLFDVAKLLREIEPKASKNLIWQWENGTQPSTRYIFALSKVFGVEVGFFYKK